MTKLPGRLRKNRGDELPWKNIAALRALLKLGPRQQEIERLVAPPFTRHRVWSDEFPAHLAPPANWTKKMLELWRQENAEEVHKFAVECVSAIEAGDSTFFAHIAEGLKRFHCRHERWFDPEARIVLTAAGRCSAEQQPMTFRNLRVAVNYVGSKYKHQGFLKGSEISDKTLRRTCARLGILLEKSLVGRPRQKNNIRQSGEN